MNEPTNSDALFKSDDFTVWHPASVGVLKSTNGERRIGGYCSTADLDRQNEVVLQRGLDFNDFVQHGYFNDNHNQATAAVVGYPEMAEFHTGKGWYTEGQLFRGVARAEEIWGLAKALTSTPRRLGFSIEGKIIERRDNMIVKARIRNVAITNCPVNVNCTWEVLAKSFHPGMRADQQPDSSEPLRRALSAGHARSAESGGRALIPEDLEKDEVKTVWPCPECAKVFASARGLDSHAVLHLGRKSMDDARIIRGMRACSFDDAVALLRRLRPNYSEAVCRRIAAYASKGA